MRRSGFSLVLAALTACGGAQTRSAQPASGGVKAIPEGFHAVTPSLVVNDVDQAVAYYQKAFGAQHRYSMKGPDGTTTLHAEVQIGDSIVMLSPEMPAEGSRSPASLGGTNGGLMLYVEDVDAVHAAAVAAGGQARMPVADQWWGDRFGQVSDPFGHVWSLATHQEELTPEEIETRAAAWGQAMAEGKPVPPFGKAAPARSWKPAEYFSVTPSLVLAGGVEELGFYEKAFGATVQNKMAGPDGKLMHGEMKIGDSVIMISSEQPEMEKDMKAARNLGGSPVSLMIYLEDTDAAFARAKAAGATEKMAPMDMFWGDRWAEVADASGHAWGLGTHKQDLTPEQMREGMLKQLGGTEGQ